MSPSPTIASQTRWRRPRKPRSICSSRSGRRASPAHGKMKRRCKRSRPARGAISRSRPGIGAISRRSGAWMSNFRGQQKLDGRQLPIVVNVMNFAKGGEGEASLMSVDDARTLFHEFGHALHGMLSDVTYPMISGTHVAGDFVEFPSQLYEHWMIQPEMLRRFALHYKTGEPMPERLLSKLLKARQFNQGWATVEYTASALVDLRLHLDPSPADVDVVAFEKQVLERIGMPEGIAMRHRTPHFQDRKSTRLNSSHANISYAVFCLKKKKSSRIVPSSL